MSRQSDQCLTDVKLAAAGRWHEIVSSLASVSAGVLDGRHYPCPKCGGNDRFRAFDDFLNTGGMICNQCFPDRNGDGFAALQWLNGWDFKTALAQVVAHLGIEPPAAAASKAKANPDEHLAWLPWSDPIVYWWARNKAGLTPESVRANGGHLARYRGQFTVIAIPVYGPQLATSSPVGWAMWNTQGPNPVDPTAGMLPVFTTKPPTWQKMKTASGSETGLIGSHGLERIRNADVVWKVEGPGDLLALWQIIPAELRDRHVVITNSAGSNENPQQWMVDLVAGKTVHIVHDADIPGQFGSQALKERGEAGGAEKWAGRFARSAETVRNVQLPYTVAPTKGKDLRDWINEGGTFEQLLALAESTADAEAAKYEPKEADDDPHRLARLFADQYWHTEGLTLRYWRDEFWRWDGRCYSSVPKNEIRAEIATHAKAEFNAINVELQEKFGDDAPPVRKVTNSLIGNIVQALAGITLLSERHEQPCWLGDSPFADRDDRDFVCLQNGILDIQAWLDNDPNHLHPHSPRWFSPICLPFKYDPAAKCDRWQAVTQRNLEGDQDRIDMLQEWFGYCLTPDTSQQKFLMMEGEGANGKSVICAVLAAMLGPLNCCHVPLEMFGQRFALTKTLGKLANIFSEVGDLDKIAEGFLKSFTAGDRMTFDRKHQAPVDAVPTARLVLATNNRPRFGDRSGGLWRRMLLLPLNARIEEHERVHGMDKAEWWIKSGELPGIFLWALEGLRELRKYRRFTIPTVTQVAIEDYRLENNPAKQFLTEKYEPDPQGEVITTTVYERYSRWCTESGYRALGSRQFAKEIVRAFPHVERVRLHDSAGKRAWGYRGVAEIDFSGSAYGNFFD